MLTTCPECQTTFRVGQAQLDAKRGLVRCGRCNAVFNALDTLDYELDVPGDDHDGAAGPGAPTPRPMSLTRENWLLADVPPTALPPLASALAGTGGGMEDRQEARAEATSSAQEPEPAREVPAGPPEQPAAWLEDLGEDRVMLKAGDVGQDSPVDNPVGAGTRRRSESDDILLSALPGSPAPGDESKSWHGLGWGLASLVLLLVFTGQMLYFLRGPLVSWMPELRPMFVAACAELGCQLPLSRELDRIRIEASSLETDPEQAAHARLRVTFSNRASGSQDWPHFVLKITDVRNEALAQRVFKPGDYLPEDRPVAAGMAALSEMEFRLDLDLGSLSAAGYEVKALYP